jgi:hypothetical protein
MSYKVVFCNNYSRDYNALLVLSGNAFRKSRVTVDFGDTEDFKTSFLYLIENPKECDIMRKKASILAEK